VYIIRCLEIIAHIRKTPVERCDHTTILSIQEGGEEGLKRVQESAPRGLGMKECRGRGKSRFKVDLTIKLRL
jgi:hypothetical protein